MILNQLAKRLSPAKPTSGIQTQTLRWTRGVIISIVDSTHVTLQIDGNATTLTATTDASGIFTVNDVVEVLVGSNRLMVIGTATAKPAGRLYASSTTGVTGTLAPITLASTDGSLNGGMTVVGNTLIAPVTGKYLCSIGQTMITASGLHVAALYVNGVLARQAPVDFNSNGTLSTLTDQVDVVAGQAIALWGQQTAGGTVNNTTGISRTWLSAVLVS